MLKIKNLVINIISVMFASVYFIVIFFTLAIISFAYILEKIQEYLENKRKDKKWKRK